MGVTAKLVAEPYQPTVATHDDAGLVVAHTVTTAALRTRTDALLADRKAVWAVRRHRHRRCLQRSVDSDAHL